MSRQARAPPIEAALVREDPLLDLALLLGPAAASTWKRSVRA
jgi:hypothetical protein